MPPQVLFVRVHKFFVRVAVSIFFHVCAQVISVHVCTSSSFFREFVHKLFCVCARRFFFVYVCSSYFCACVTQASAGNVCLRVHKLLSCVCTQVICV